MLCIHETELMQDITLMYSMYAIHMYMYTRYHIYVQYVCYTYEYNLIHIHIIVTACYLHVYNIL